MHWIRYSFASWVLLVLASSGWGQSTLAWKWKKGDKFSLKLTATSSQVMKVTLPSKNAVGEPEQKETKQNTEQKVEYAFEVLDVLADKSVVLEQSIANVQFLSNEKPFELGKAGSALKGAKLKVTLNTKSEVTKVEGIKEILEKLDKNPLAEALLSEDMLKNTWKSLTGFLPSKAVKKDDTWEQVSKESLGLLGECVRTNSYKLEAQEDVSGKKIERITFKGKLEQTTTKPATLPKALPFEITEAKLTADDVKGTYYFDAELGRLTQADTYLTLTGPLQLRIEGLTVKGTIKSDYILRIVVSDK